MSRRAPPALERLLRKALRDSGAHPAAFVLAGHNGSGKSTLWYQRLVPILRMPLINADRLTASILPLPEDGTGQLPPWARRLRDDDERWQRLSQEGVRAFKRLVMEERIPFAFETVFSHWRRLPDGSFESKADDIRQLQAAGYFVVLVFVGLAGTGLSLARVATRRLQGGHGVPVDKLRRRFARTQAAVGHAAPIADMAILLDNSRGYEQAFTLARVQQGRQVLFDCRDAAFRVEASLRAAATPWLEAVAGAWQEPPAPA